MHNIQQALHILNSAELIYSESAITQAISRLAREIEKALSHQYPVVLCVMDGAVVFAGQLLPQLEFPLDFDFVQVSRYGNKLRGGDISWRVKPKESIAGRVVLVLDDILDEGVTLAAIRDLVMENGAQAFYSGVLVEKDTNRSKSIQADFVGLTVPNRYVFGFGMDIHGAWRNLPAIYAVRD